MISHVMALTSTQIQRTAADAEMHAQAHINVYKVFASSVVIMCAMEMKMHRYVTRTAAVYLPVQIKNVAVMDAAVHAEHAQTENHAMKGNASLF